MIINSWKEFFHLLPVELQNSNSEKYYRKLFSIASKNRWAVNDENGKFFTFNRINGNFKQYHRFAHLNKVLIEGINVNKIVLEQLECLSTGVTYQLNTKTNHNTVVIDSKGNHFLIPLSAERAINELTYKKVEDFVEITNKSTLEYTFFREENENVLKVEGFWSHYLVIKDALWFKKGQIVDTTGLEYSRPYEQNPLEIFKNKSIYTGFDRNSIASDLNKVTLEEIKAIDFSKDHRCSKQQFGCQNGCTNTCFYDTYIRVKAGQKSKLIELKTKLENLK